MNVFTFSLAFGVLFTLVISSFSLSLSEGGKMKKWFLTLASSQMWLEEVPVHIYSDVPLRPQHSSFFFFFFFSSPFFQDLLAVCKQLLLFYPFVWLVAI